ncbi:PepSY domain-containing protein [Gilvimarinus sp. F26214L]|uniref:PepSY domain-containing protein n=1 Tax=Gilvimarinus sp. DZF01 TaxID=3461371 RepID=UPI00404640D4
MSRRKIFSFALCALLCASISSAANADKKPQPARAGSVAEAAKIAKRRHDGKILKVQTLKTDQGLVYRVRILQPDGTITTIAVRGR